MRLELRQLRYFLALADELHFGRAAERVFITQPSLTHQIHALEAELGVRLFQRTSRNVQLTDAGRALVRTASQLLTDLERGVAEVQRIGGAARERLRIGVLTEAYADHGVVADALASLTTRFPKTVVEVAPLSGAPIPMLLDAGTFDVVFSHTPVGRDGLRIVVLTQERLCAALPTGHALSGVESVRLEDLRDEGFLMPPADDAPDKHDELLSYCRRAGFEPRIAAFPASLQACLRAVARGEGVCLAPSGSSRSADVVLKPLSSPFVVLTLVAIAPLEVSAAVSAWLSGIEGR